MGMLTELHIWLVKTNPFWWKRIRCARKRARFGENGLINGGNGFVFTRNGRATFSRARISSNSNQTIAKTYEKHEREKKTSYLHRVLEVEKSTFTPLVMSTTGGLGREFNKTLKQLAEKKAAKTGYSYDQCIRYLRLRLSFAMVRSVTISIRGHRGRLRAEGSSSRDDNIYQID